MGSTEGKTALSTHRLVHGEGTRVIDEGRRTCFIDGLVDSDVPRKKAKETGRRREAGRDGEITRFWESRQIRGLAPRLAR